MNQWLFSKHSIFIYIVHLGWLERGKIHNVLQSRPVIQWKLLNELMKEYINKDRNIIINKNIYEIWQLPNVHLR